MGARSLQPPYKIGRESSKSRRSLSQQRAIRPGSAGRRGVVLGEYLEAGGTLLTLQDADPQDHLRVRRENQLRITIHISKQLDCLVREFPNLRIWIECPSGNDFWKLAE